MRTDCGIAFNFIPLRSVTEDAVLDRGEGVFDGASAQPHVI
jgi:hypothetical protein